jgi:hypothetical protein
MTNKITVVNTVHIAGRGLVIRQLRILASQFRVLRTGTLSEIRNDNLQVTVSSNARRFVGRISADKNKFGNSCLNS